MQFGMHITHHSPADESGLCTTSRRSLTCASTTCFNASLSAADNIAFKGRKAPGPLLVMAGKAASTGVVGAGGDASAAAAAAAAAARASAAAAALARAAFAAAADAACRSCSANSNDCAIAVSKSCISCIDCCASAKDA